MESILQTFKVKKSGVLAFTLGMVGAMIMVTIQMLGLHPAEFLRPIVSREHVTNIQDEISPRLRMIKNDYKLNKGEAFIPKAYAAAVYDEAAAYAVVDFESGKVVASKNLSEERPIASITKVMTAVVAQDLVDNDEEFVITKKASAAIPTKIGVVEGEKMKVSELLAAAMLTSANDATEAIRDGIDKKYGRGTTVAAMNEKAELIGLSSSNFTNPQGFDYGQHYSSVEDVAILARYALANYPSIANVADKDYKFLPQDANHKQFDLYNWNGLIGVYPGTTGLKIGYTGDAGYTTVVVSERSGRRFISVVLGAPGVRERDMWAASLLDFAFETEAGLPPVNLTEEQLDAKYKSWQYFN